MATDPLASLIKQRSKELDALAIETRNKFYALQTDALADTEKQVKEQLSAFQKQVDQLLAKTQRRIEQELAKQISSSLFGNSSGGSGQSHSQMAAQLSTVLSSAWRNL